MEKESPKTTDKKPSRVGHWIVGQVGKLPPKVQQGLVIGLLAAGFMYAGMRIAGTGNGGLPDMGKIIGTTPPTLQRDLDKARNKLNSLKSWLDSLGQCPECRELRDSVLKYNPGLLDSITKWDKQIEEKTKK